MMLCFGFKRKPVLTTDWCFRGCRAVLTLSQGLFCLLCCPASVEELGLQKELKGDRNRTDDLGWPKGHSILYDVMQSNKTGGADWGGGPATAWGLAGHCLVSGEQLHCTSLSLGTIYYYYFPFIFCPIKLLLSQPTSFTFFFFFFLLIFFSNPLWGSEWTAVWCLAAWQLIPHYRFRFQILFSCRLLLHECWNSRLEMHIFFPFFPL